MRRQKRAVGAWKTIGCPPFGDSTSGPPPTWRFAASLRGSRPWSGISKGRMKSKRTAKGASLGLAARIRPATDRSSGLQREVLFAGADRHGQPVLLRREGTDVGVAVGAIRTVSQIEVQHIVVRLTFLDVEIPAGAILHLARGRVAKGDEQAVVLVAVTRW